MHGQNTWFDVLDAARRALSNASISTAIGSLFQELFASECRASVAQLASSACSSITMHRKNTQFQVLDSARRAPSNASIATAIGALLKELFVPDRPALLIIAAELARELSLRVPGMHHAAKYI
jgi:hypothetical protein